MKIFSIFVGFMWSKRSKCDTNAPDLVDRSHPGFVYAPGDGNLYLDGKLFNFRNFNAPTIFEGGEYQGRDILKSVAAFGNPVTRTYTLQISNDALQFGKLPASSGHVTGWDKNSNDWIYNESQWRKMDQMLDLSRHYGVKLIIPIINQDYGNPESNYIGDFNDVRPRFIWPIVLQADDHKLTLINLIRHRYGIYGYKDAGNRIDFFKDRIMIDSFKKLITFFLERVNTYNGIRYGDDNTILAFETGNEMSWGQFANLSMCSQLICSSRKHALTAISHARRCWTCPVQSPSILFYFFSVDGTDECREENSGLLRFPGTSKRWHQKF
ncbi:hypothetical protein MJO28_001962 [Puccinia striiformis f. sp. tritici]|uniref:Uncharacterized protein n=1 Tax=Puccinia striiformis f. sp. tritici TaxID=168172 RepID=A0ACC0EXB9_9BASI|nr:hypothetical protein MJO28_001962 [Puccinia striiformis f. sp. tritici]